jgi:hypothetical protein
MTRTSARKASDHFALCHYSCSFSIQFSLAASRDPCTRFPVKACVGPPWPRIPTNFRKEISTSHSHRGRRDQARSTRSEKGNPHVLVLVPKICNPHGLHLGYLLVMGFVFLASMPFCMRFSKFSCSRSIGIGLLWPVTECCSTLDMVTRRASDLL